ncbi:hypothetical protein BDW22DRAFT_1429642 [Trametopsis cervina]|nr:hypothetical protein BDW22DRAFT_1429642 [Trametopsis cervina]
MLRTEFITSPSGTSRPLDPRPEVDSDELWLAKFKSKGGKKGKKKGKGTSTSPSFIPSSDIVPVNSDYRTDSPLSRFLPSSVTQMTGYSPLNPTSSLQDEFHASNLSALGTDSDFPTNAKSPLAFARHMLVPTPLSRVPSEGSASDSASQSTTSYEAIRPQLFQQAFIESINGGKFDDTEIYVYSARSRSGQVHKPRSIRARRAFLNAASQKFEYDIGPAALIQGHVDSSRKAGRQEYDYDMDSDLDEYEVEPTTGGNQISTSPQKKSDDAAAGGTPKSTVLNLSDGDVLSLDGFGSETGLSEILQDITPGTLSTTAPKPPLSLETTAAVLSWRNEHETRDATPRDAPSDLPGRTSPFVEQTPVTPVSQPATLKGEVTLFMPNSAHRTWQSLLLYLYNDYIEFAPLRSQRGHGVLLNPTGLSCSPKSMYRLATKLGLEHLRQKAFQAIEQSLSKENIVKELFSDFTWRYPEILVMQTNVFYKHSCEAMVQKEMSETFQEIALGRLPHSSIVLSSLFNRQLYI